MGMACGWCLRSRDGQEGSNRWLLQQHLRRRQRRWFVCCRRLGQEGSSGRGGGVSGLLVAGGLDMRAAAAKVAETAEAVVRWLQASWGGGQHQHRQRRRWFVGCRRPGPEFVGVVGIAHESTNSRLTVSISREKKNRFPFNCILLEFLLEKRART